MVDALASGASVRMDVEVQVLSRAPSMISRLRLDHHGMKIPPAVMAVMAVGSIGMTR